MRPLRPPFRVQPATCKDRLRSKLLRPTSRSPMPMPNHAAESHQISAETLRVSLGGFCRSSGLVAQLTDHRREAIRIRLGAVVTHARLTLFKTDFHFLHTA